MADREAFMETVRDAAQMARTAGRELKKEEIISWFEDMELLDSQLEMVYQYLLDIRKEETDGTAKNHDAECPAGAGMLDGTETKMEMEMPQSLFFQMYVQDLEGIERCSDVEEDRLYRMLADGDETAVRLLCDQWLGRVFDLAKRMSPGTEHIQDVIQEGNAAVFLKLGELLGAGERTDYRDILENAAEEAMEAYILEVAGWEDAEQAVLAKAALVYEAQKTLAKEFQRMPTNEELSWYTKLPVEELEDVFAMARKKPGVS